MMKTFGMLLNRMMIVPNKHLKEIAMSMFLIIFPHPSEEI